MVEPMIRYALLMLLSLSSIQPVCAELVDPTRPPAGYSTSGVARSSVEKRNSGLHFVIISKYRRAAIINGQTVELGEKYGNAQLVEVNEGDVVLQGPQGRQVLHLFPGVKISQKNESLYIKPHTAVESGVSGSDSSGPAMHKEVK